MPITETHGDQRNEEDEEEIGVSIRAGNNQHHRHRQYIFSHENCVPSYGDLSQLAIFMTILDVSSEAQRKHENPTSNNISTSNSSSSSIPPVQATLSQRLTIPLLDALHRRAHRQLFNVIVVEEDEEITARSSSDNIIRLTPSYTNRICDIGRLVGNYDNSRLVGGGDSPTVVSAAVSLMRVTTEAVLPVSALAPARGGCLCNTLIVGGGGVLGGASNNRRSRINCMYDPIGLRGLKLKMDVVEDNIYNGNINLWNGGGKGGGIDGSGYMNSNSTINGKLRRGKDGDGFNCFDSEYEDSEGDIHEYNSNNAQELRNIIVYKLRYPSEKLYLNRNGVQQDQDPLLKRRSVGRSRDLVRGVILSPIATAISNTHTATNKTMKYYYQTVQPSSRVSIGAPGVELQFLRLLDVNDRILGCVVSSISNLTLHVFFKHEERSNVGGMTSIPINRSVSKNCNIIRSPPLALCIRQYTPTPHGSSNFIPPCIANNTIIPIITPHNSTTSTNEEDYIPYLSISSIPPNSIPFLLHTAFKTINRLGLMNLARLLCGGYNTTSNYSYGYFTSLELNNATGEYNNIGKWGEHHQEESIIRALFSIYLHNWHNHNNTSNIGEISWNPSEKGKGALNANGCCHNKSSIPYSNSHNYRPSMISLWHSPSNDPHQNRKGLEGKQNSSSSSGTNKRPCECPLLCGISWSGGMALTYVWANALLLQRTHIHLHQYPRSNIITHVTIAYTNCDPIMLRALATAVPSLVSLTLEYIGASIRANHVADFFRNRRRSVSSMGCQSDGSPIGDNFECLRLRRMKHLFDKCRNIDRNDPTCDPGDTIGRGVFDFFGDIDEVKSSCSSAYFKYNNNNNSQPYRKVFELEIAECGLTDAAGVALIKALRKKTRVDNIVSTAVPIYLSLPNNQLTDSFLRNAFSGTTDDGNGTIHCLPNSVTIGSGSLPLFDQYVLNITGLNINNNNMKQLKASDLYDVLHGLTSHIRHYGNTSDVSNRNITAVVGSGSTFATHYSEVGFEEGATEDMSSRDSDVYRYSTRYCNLYIGECDETVIPHMSSQSSTRIGVSPTENPQGFIECFTQHVPYVPRLLLMQGTSVPLDEWVNFMRLLRRFRGGKDKDDKGGWRMCTVIFPEFSLSFSQGYFNTLHLSPPSTSHGSSMNGVHITFYQIINKLLGDSCSLLPRFEKCTPIDLTGKTAKNSNKAMEISTSYVLPEHGLDIGPKSNHMRKSIFSGNARKKLEKKKLLGFEKERRLEMKGKSQREEIPFQGSELAKGSNNTRNEGNKKITTSDKSYTDDLEECDAFFESLEKDFDSQKEHRVSKEEEKERSDDINKKVYEGGESLREGGGLRDWSSDGTDNPNWSSGSFEAQHGSRASVTPSASTHHRPRIVRFSEVLAPYLSCLSLVGCDLREGMCSSSGMASSKKWNKTSGKDTTSVYFPSNHVFFNTVLVSLLPLLHSLDLSSCSLGNDGAARLGVTLEKSALLLQQIHPSSTITVPHNDTAMSDVVEIGLPLAHLKLDYNNITGVDGMDISLRAKSRSGTQEKNHRKAPNSLVHGSSTLSIRYFLKGLRGCVCPTLESLSLKYNVIPTDDIDEVDSSDSDGEVVCPEGKAMCGIDNVDNTTSSPHHHYHPLFKALFIFASQVNKTHFRELDLSGNKGLFHYINPVQRRPSHQSSNTGLHGISALSYLVESFRSLSYPIDDITVTGSYRDKILSNKNNNSQTVVIHLKHIQKSLEGQWSACWRKTDEPFRSGVCKTVVCTFI